VPASSEGAPLVVAFHGYAASKSALLPVAAALRELDCATFLVDFYGSGDSSGDGTSLGYLEAADVAAALDYARGRWPGRKVGLYGFSMGSAAILRAIAVADADPDAIVLEATFDDLLSTAKNRFDSMGLPATPLAELLLFWGGVQWGFDPFTHNPADYAAAVRCPAMVLHGERDARATLDQGRRVAAAMGEHATFVANPGLGHMPGVIADRTAWKRDVGGFLARNLTASDGDGLTGSGG